MLIEILYHDDSIVVIDKPAGLLSVPGRGAEMKNCAAARIRNQFAGCIDQPSVHRLDMDTSGLLIFALTPEAHRRMSIQFQRSEVRKEYTAVLDGKVKAESGRIELKFRLAPENRPYQVYDPVLGKTGITLWEKIEEHEGKTRVLFRPLTGRTHQLRLHAAHPFKEDGTGGLGCPISGDRLYGGSSDEEHRAGTRMLLHASKIEFVHPITSEPLAFFSEAPF